jgi:hypothetical protein
MKSLREMYMLVKDAGFDSILVDTCVMNLPTTGFTLIANRLVKEEFGLPVGSAPANASYMWRGALEKWGPEAFRGMDAGMHAISTVLWSDWMACGPMTGIRRVFTTVAAATAVLSIMAWDEGSDLPDDPHHPLNLHWPQEVEIIWDARERHRVSCGGENNTGRPRAKRFCEPRVTQTTARHPVEGLLCLDKRRFLI